jgi:simple sugar transport system permease protein
LKLAPLSESLTIATPLALAGLAVAVPFRAGLFNIGVQGQIIAGSIIAGGIGFSWHLPSYALLLCAVIGGMIGGAVYSGFAGWLKARTGAHEVITTIMLNYIALYFLQWLLTTKAFQRPGRNDPISPIIPDNGMYPRIFGGVLRVHYGLFVAIGAAVLMWWLFKYTTFGFRMRTVGANSAAARTAGINVGRIWLYAMLLAGAFAGLAATTTLLGTEGVLTAGIAGSLGFDAITVALLGKATPLGTILAAFLFGALHAGGTTMQAVTGVPVDIVLVLQAVIVLFIAAPPLVRAIFRLRVPAEAPMQASKGWNG